MSNINELTAKLKAAALEALPANERLSVLPPDDIFDISLFEGEQLDRDVAVMNSFSELANPSNILELTEALEAAECRIIELSQKYEIDPRTHEIIDLKEVIAEQDQRLLDYASIATKNAEKIADLEARTLTVKLPDYVDGNTLGYGEVNHMIDLCADAFEKACHRAGIKLQIEGE